MIGVLRERSKRVSAGCFRRQLAVKSSALNSNIQTCGRHAMLYGIDVYHVSPKNGVRCSSWFVDLVLFNFHFAVCRMKSKAPVWVMRCGW